MSGCSRTSDTDATAQNYPPEMLCVVQVMEKKNLFALCQTFPPVPIFCVTLLFCCHL